MRRAPVNGTLELLTTAPAHHQAGRSLDAEALYRRVLGEDPENMDALHLLGALAHQAGRHEEALGLIERAITVNPGVADFHASLGTTLKALGRLSEAAQSYERALGLESEHLDALNNLGTVRTAQGRLGDAEACFQRALARRPDFAEAHNNLGNALQGQGRFAEAEECFRRALALRPHYVDAQLNLGNVLTAEGRVEDGIQSYRMALAQAPDRREPHVGLAHALLRLGRAAEAEPHCRRLIADDPESAELYGNLASALSGQGKHEEAVASARLGLALDPRIPETYLNLANVLIGLGGLDEAAECCRSAVLLRPDSADAHTSLGNVLIAQGRLDEAIESYRYALVLRPDSAEALSNLIFALEFHPATTSAEAFAERRRWNDVHALPLARHRVPHANVPDPERRLRIGYVSADFRENSAATIFGPVLFAHDRERFDVVCYSGVVTPDPATTRFQAAATVWRPTLGMGDEALARLIREDAIDILVDLSGYSAGHRLKVFARKPAPIQVTAWGHALGTGLDAMDYFFADAVTVPPAARRYFSEEVIELPAFVPYRPILPSPEVNALPALTNGAPTFGCFNRLSKVTPESLALWARVTKGVPGSRLLLKIHGLERPALQASLRRAFADQGGDPERLAFLGGTSQREHLAAYGEVDLALDPFPHGGGVTALDGLWMGVPMVTLCGERIPSRMGASILTTLGLPEFIATTRGAYVEIAVRRARELGRLAGLRAELRGRLRASIICDHGAYCRAVEGAYRAMWRRWCASRGASPA